LRIIAEREEETADAAAPLVLNVLLALRMKTIVFFPAGGTGRPRDLTGEIGAAATDKTDRNLCLAIPPRLAPPLKLTTTDGTTGGIAKAELANARPSRLG
jgi:hypothetical protein